MKPAKTILIVLFSFFMFNLIYGLAVHQGKNNNQQLIVNQIENRIALDLPKLRLANKRFNTVAHNGSVEQYLSAINQQLSDSGAYIRLASLQTVSDSQLPMEGTVTEYSLQTADQNIPYQILELPLPLSMYLSIYPFLAFAIVLILYLIARHFNRGDESENGESSQQPVQARLVIDLLKKTINNGVDDRQIHLSNKPFCFYIALLQYCMNNPHPQLNHNKNVPDDLIALANKYFYRLIEIGHTKRKRPDFSTNLDKTLSEIRAALDDVFHDFPDEKDRYYPPKAQGEGSRSKLHNYALELLIEENIEFIGK